MKIRFYRCRYFTQESCFRSPVLCGFGEFKNAVVTCERVQAPRFILFLRCIVVIVPFIIRVSPSIESSFLFFHNVGTKDVIGFQFSVGEFRVTMVVIMYNDKIFRLLLKIDGETRLIFSTTRKSVEKN